MKSLITLALGAGLLVSAVAADARPINLRQANQERRIDAGVRSGKLTHAEAARLKAEQRSVSAYSAMLRRKHGGKLTAADKRRIERRQNIADSHILSQKHDAQRGRNKLKVKL